MSPSNAAHNRVMGMSVDFILPPCFPDAYSAASVHGLLTSILPEWYWHAQYSKYDGGSMHLQGFAFVSSVLGLTGWPCGVGIGHPIWW